MLALFDHLPYDGPSLSIGFDLSVRDYSAHRLIKRLRREAGGAEDAARPGSFAAYMHVVRTRDRAAGAGYSCNARPDLHTICRSFTELSSVLSAKFCGGSRSAKR